MALLKTPVSKDDHIQGNFNAPITLVEYGDYECPYCGNAEPIVKNLQKHFSKQMRFIFRNFPLAEVHPYAMLAAETAEFADSKGKFWEMHDLLYKNQSLLNPELCIKLVQGLKLPTEEYEIAIQNHAFEEKIKRSFMSGVRSGVNGTPTFFINEQRYNGPAELEEMISAIEEAVNV